MAGVSTNTVLSTNNTHNIAPPKPKSSSKPVIGFGRSSSTGRSCDTQKQHIKASSLPRPGSASRTPQQRGSFGLTHSQRVTANTTLVPAESGPAKTPVRARRCSFAKGSCQQGIMFSPPKMATNATVYKTTAAWRARTGRADELISAEIVFSPPQKTRPHPHPRRSLGSATRPTAASQRRMSAMPAIYASALPKARSRRSLPLSAADGGQATQASLAVQGPERGGLTTQGRPQAATDTCIDAPVESLAVVAQPVDDDCWEPPAGPQEGGAAEHTPAGGAVLNAGAISEEADLTVLKPAVMLPPSAALQPEVQQPAQRPTVSACDPPCSPQLEQPAATGTPALVVPAPTAVRSPSVLGSPPAVAREYCAAVSAHSTGRLQPTAAAAVVSHCKQAVKGEWLPVVWYTAHVCPAASCAGAAACCCPGSFQAKFRYSAAVRAHRSLAVAVRRQLRAASQGGHRVQSDTGQAMLAILQWQTPAATPLGVLWDSVAERRAGKFQELLTAAAAAHVMDSDALQWLLSPPAEV